LGILVRIFSTWGVFDGQPCGRSRGVRVLGGNVGLLGYAAHRRDSINI